MNMNQTKQLFSHMLSDCSFSNNMTTPIALKGDKYYIYLDIYTAVFYWGVVNSKKKYPIMYKVS